jgi:hypothetical protein
VVIIGVTEGYQSAGSIRNQIRIVISWVSLIFESEYLDITNAESLIKLENSLDQLGHQFFQRKHRQNQW